MDVRGKRRKNCLGWAVFKDIGRTVKLCETYLYGEEKIFLVGKERKGTKGKKGKTRKGKKKKREERYNTP